MERKKVVHQRRKWGCGEEPKRGEEPKDSGEELKESGEGLRTSPTSSCTLQHGFGHIQLPGRAVAFSASSRAAQESPTDWLGIQKRQEAGKRVRSHVPDGSYGYGDQR